MSKDIFAIGDIHGMYDLFEDMLTNYNSDRHQLVLLGDLNDRGHDVKSCLYKGKQLVEEEGAVYLKGNHEDLFLNFLERPEEMYERYRRNGGKETIESLLHAGAVEEYSPTEISLMIRSRHTELVEFLRELPMYFEWHHFIFVHAGIDLSKRDWHDTSSRDFMWIREPFYEGTNTSGKTVVFGHTITPSLHGDMQTTDIWQSDNRIGIDGGAVYGGSLHGVILNESGIIQDIELQNTTGPWEPSD